MARMAAVSSLVRRRPIANEWLNDLDPIVVSTVMQLQPLSEKSLPKNVKRFAGQSSCFSEDSESANTRWLTSPELPLDMGGPVDRAYDRMGAEFSSVPAIEHLSAVAKKFADHVAVSDSACQITY